MKAILNQDVFSTFRPATQYGKKGERVTIIAYHGNALIVENTNGKKYSITSEKVTYEKVQ
ncbi:MAG: hypothetical protein WCH59_09145 [Chitinophagia bacterium]|jgi:predicted proteasome-type protease